MRGKSYAVILLLQLLFCLVSANTDAFLTWGYNLYYQQGSGASATEYGPVWMNLTNLGSSAVSFLGAGDRYGALLTDTGNVFTWGYSDYLGRAYTTTVETIGGGYSALLTGYSTTVALKPSGSLFGWGLPAHAELGSPSIFLTSTPTQFTIGAWSSTTISKLWSAGCWHYAGNTTSSLVLWGANTYGQLGDGTFSDSPSPVSPTYLLSNLAPGELVLSVSMGCEVTFVNTTQGLISFGRSDFGQTGTASPSQVRVSLPAVPINLAHGNCHSLAILADNTVYGWGCNTSAQLSAVYPRQPDPSYSATPLKLDIIPARQNESPVQVSCLGNTSFLLTDTGNVYAWGDMNFKISAFIGQSLTSGKTPFPALTSLRIASSSKGNIVSLISAPFCEQGNAYSGFARVSSPVPSAAPSAVPSTPLPPTISPTPSLQCPQPSPQPISQFECINGVWTALHGITDGNGTIIIGTPIVVIGDWNTTSTVIILNPGNVFVNVSGCLYLNGSLEVHLNDPTSAPKSAVPIFETPCAGSVPPLTTIKFPKKSCRKVTAAVQTAQTASATVVSLLFRTDDFQCKLWWIVLVSVVGALALICAVIAIIATRVECCRKLVRPFSARKGVSPEVR